MSSPADLARLSVATLGTAHPALVPTYDRGGAAPIVHLGVGAFARAHLGVYADDLLRGGGGATIHGVSLRSGTAEEQLASQDGLYTVTEREPDRPDERRVVGSFTRMGTGADQAIAAIAAPTTRLVTLTVTEKGYDHDGSPESVPAVLARGLGARDRSVRPPTIASLDNLLGNGTLLRERVLAAADELDPTLGPWIADAVAFPCSVVDRMVPATLDADRRVVADALGFDDQAAVVAEHHCSWIAEDSDALRPFGAVGVELVDDVEPYERRKLWLLNGPHSAFAYLGLLAGHETIADAALDPTLDAFVERFTEDVLAASDLPAALDAASFAADCRARFANPALGHTCLQVGADGSRKLAQRVVPVIARRRAAALPTDRLATVLAAWLVAAAGVPVRGRLLPAVSDPQAEVLRRATVSRDVVGLVGAAFGEHGDPMLVREVAAAFRELTDQGIGAIERR